jgi:hypothetical protein
MSGDARDCNNIETRELSSRISPPPLSARQGAEGNSRHFGLEKQLKGRNFSLRPGWTENLLNFF